MNQRKFAVFDVDGTLVRWQLFHSIVNELAAQGNLGASASGVIHSERMKWKNRTSHDSFHDYESKLVNIFLDAITEVPIADYDRAVEHVFDQYKDQVYTYTHRLIQKLCRENYFLIAISGSHQEIIDKIAKHYGFDLALGTKFERSHNKLTGKTKMVVDRKGETLQDIIKLNNLSIDDSYAVGDSANDFPMMELVSNPIAFNPDQKLLDMAKEQNWQIVIERKNVIYELRSLNGSYVLA